MKKLLLALFLLFSVSCIGQIKQEKLQTYKQSYYPNVMLNAYSENTVHISLTYISRMDSLWKLRMYNNDRGETITFIRKSLKKKIKMEEGLMFGYEGIDSATKAPLLLSVLRKPNKHITSIGMTNRQWLVVMYIFTPQYSSYD